jgi:hypothetical protein
VDPPAAGQVAQVGVAYGVTLSCATTFRMGGLWWAFDDPTASWPPPMPGPPFPFGIFETVSDPYPVPGIVTLTDPETATFRADSDGSELALTGYAENPEEGNACL